MWIDDVTLANAIAARLGDPPPIPIEDDLDEMYSLYVYGSAVLSFRNKHRSGPYRPTDQLLQAVADKFGRPAGEEWQLADWARRIQDAMDGAERRTLGHWEATETPPPPQHRERPYLSMRTGFMTDPEVTA